MCRLFLMTIACLLVLFGISGLWMMPKLIQQKIEQRIQLKIGTKAFDRFTKVPIPLNVKFYLFNVTNSERVLQGLERPQFQEVGPFMYKQWRRRDIVDFEDYNRRLKYREIKTFYPMYPRSISANASNSPSDTDATHPSDKQDSTQKMAGDSASNKTAQAPSEPFMLDPHSVNITMINVPLLSVLTKLADFEEGSLMRQITSKVLSRLVAERGDQILITRQANQILFDGYKVDFLESAREMLSKTLGFNFDSPLPGNKFGFFNTKNGTWNRRENGEMTLFTGRNGSMDEFMQVENWNDQRRLSVWPSNTEAGDRCNQIKGTDGSQFHPGVSRTRELSIFSPMVCTSLSIRYKEDTSARDIPLLRFSTPAEIFAAPRKNPRNACYCTISPKNSLSSLPAGWSSSSLLNTNPPKSPHRKSRITDSRCYLDGLMDLSLCQRGAPIAASSPHFYNGDPMLAMAAGLKPNKDIHETYIDIEPMTGAVFRAASRAQLNAFVEQAALDVVDSSIIGNMTPMVAPLLWLEESAEIDEKSSREFKSQLLNLVQKAKRTFIYSIILGIILAVAVSSQYWYVTCYSIDTELKRKELREKLEGSEERGRKRRPTDGARRSTSRSNSRGHLNDNMRLGGGARKSNILAGSESAKPMLGLNDDDDDDDYGDAKSPASSSGIADVVPVIGLAAAMGAAHASATNSSRRANQPEQQQHRRRNKRSAGDYERSGANEDELSKQVLVANEWEAAAATTNSSAGSSSGALNRAAQEHSSEGEHSLGASERHRADVDGDQTSELVQPSTSSANEM